MAIPFPKRLISVSEYHQMAKAGILKENDRVELIQGEIIQMSPIGSMHSAYVNRINALLNQHLGGQAIISVQNPIQLNDFSEPEPDIAILKLKDDFYIQQHPGPQDVFLLIEVSDSSIAYDQEIKLPNYALVEIPECWIVNLEKSHIEMYRSPRNGSYSLRKILYPGDNISLDFFHIDLKVSDIFI